MMAPEYWTREKRVPTNVQYTYMHAQTQAHTEIHIPSDFVGFLCTAVHAETRAVRSFKAAWTPPYGPAYISWHSDYNDERVRTEIIAQDLVDPRMRVRPNPDEIQRAAEAPRRGADAAHG